MQHGIGLLADACRVPQRVERQLRDLPREVESSARRGIGAQRAEPVGLYNRTVRSRSALPMTSTELKLIAALAIIGLSSTPLKG